MWGAELHVTRVMRVRQRVSEAARCPFCHDACAAGWSVVGCEWCRALQHASCWKEHGKCAACRGTNPRRRRVPSGGLIAAILVPVTFGFGLIRAIHEKPMVVVIPSGHERFDHAFGPDYWAAPSAGEPTRRVWALNKGGNGWAYQWDGSRGGRYRWVPD